MMIVKKKSKIRLRGVVFGIFLAMMATLGSLGGTLMLGEPVYADPAENTATTTTTENTTGDNTGNNAGATTGTNTGTAVSTGDDCKNSLGAIGWLVCPTTGAIAQGVDFLYGLIKDFLVIDPVVQQDGSPIYEIWKYCRGFANIVFIIFLLVVIYSQITGVGISNYGIKKALPKLIVVAVLMNLSFLICSLAVDVSNILGESVRGLFDSVASSAVPANSGMNSQEMAVANAEMYSAMAGGTALTIGGAVIAFETGTIWMLIPLLLGAIVAVVTGLITIALRQAVVALLIMIAPLAVVAYMLPNTENLFMKWRKLLTQMLVFYPAFSLLFGASSLAGFAIIMSAQNGFGLLLGVAVQIFPLFFSWKLMQMSGTFLGTINSKMRELGSKPVAGARTWAGTRKAHTNAKYLQYGTTPFSHLRRYMDNKRELEEQHTASIQQLRKYDANIYAQKVIGAGYDGTKAQGTKGNLTPNKYTKVAKDLSNTKLASETVTMDTAHVLGNYSDYFVDEKIRERVTKAREAKDEAALEALRRTDAEYRRADIGAKNFLEYSRAEMTAENDSESDFKFMVNEFLQANESRNDATQMAKYKHYIESSAGGLGAIGTTRVLGKIIAKAAAVESNQRRDINIIANKYPPDKRSFRNMVVGYYVDDNGYATDKEGNVLLGEKYRGYLLQHHPEQLVLWDQVDDDGPYYDWKDPKTGKVVAKIHKHDKSAIKELLSNFDTPICDPINNLYGILAGVKEGDITGGDEKLKNIGLDGYRTTIGRALLSFKDKNAAFSPMVKEMISRGYIENYAQEYLAYLDSLTKATKPGAWNVQDKDAVEMFALIMDPENWDEVFPTELIRKYKNVNGNPITGIRYDENGDKIKVPANEATRDELMETVKDKYIKPALKKMPAMTRRMTPNMIENQKPEVAKAWKELFAAIDKCGEKLGVWPYDKAQDMGEIVSDIRQKYDNGDQSQGNMNTNHHVMVDEMQINSNGDADDFARSFAEYCDRYPDLLGVRAKREFNDFVVNKGYGATVDELYDYAIEILDAYTYID